MSKTLIDIDDSLLERARAILGPRVISTHGEQQTLLRITAFVAADHSCDRASEDGDRPASATTIYRALAATESAATAVAARTPAP